jgi:lipopolysaccharide/colanic/teichoic acid biosynthesis glycosyltransferase
MHQTQPPNAHSRLVNQLTARSRAKSVPWRHYDGVKRAIDLSICLICLPFALALMAVVAVAVLILDGRPVFLVQPRTGLGGTRFPLLKFRTMVRNAGEMKKQLLHLNELTLPDFKISNDPRMTKLGRVLRKTSLDELPQILNVIRGEMSLVGPRPTSFAEDTYKLWQTERLEVLPGITGLWQVNGRAELDFEDRARLDIQYVTTRSLALDMSILIQTVPAVLSSRGAS